MSGGAFDYLQDKLGYEVYPVIEENILNENKFGISSESFRLIVDGYNAIKKAEVYLRRIDWLLSGDDGEEEFRERLQEELQTAKENEHKFYRCYDCGKRYSRGTSDSDGCVVKGIHKLDEPACKEFELYDEIPF